MAKEVIRIFVFGSNEAGRHGLGSAREALKYGARFGKGEGLQGLSYGIPTKDRNLKSLSLQEIQIYVNKFIAFARQHPEMQFDIVAIGCGLTGYKPYQIAPMFIGAPENCILPQQFKNVLKGKK